MEYDSILSNVQRHIAISEMETAYFCSLLGSQTLYKNELVQEQGRICNTINFIDSGILRAFFINKDGKDSTIMFATKDWWITDMYCFLNIKPALLNIEALEESRVLQLKFIQLEELYNKIPKFEKFFRILMQNAYVREQLRVLDNISLTTEERYNRFIQKYPQIVKRVTQKQIASYLGVTPEFLSAVKRKSSAS